MVKSWIKSGTGLKPKPNPNPIHNPNPKWTEKTNPHPTPNINTNPVTVWQFILMTLCNNQILNIDNYLTWFNLRLLTNHIIPWLRLAMINTYVSLD